MSPKPDSAQRRRGPALIVPDAAKRSMINKAIKHTPDLREEKVAALYRTDRTAHAWRPHAALREVIAGNAIRDLAGRDISFDVNGGGSL